jgi:FkbM family methyltransferase
MSTEWATDATAPRTSYLLNAHDIRAALAVGRRVPPLRLRSGITIYHGDADPVLVVFHEIFVGRCYTDPEFYMPAAGDIVIDCGANIGVFALHLANMSNRIRVFCFEPCSDTRQRLNENIVGNGLQEQLTSFPFALWDRETRSDLRVMSISGGTSLFDSNEFIPVAHETVQCVTLKRALDLCGVTTVDLLKIDAEGAEAQILRGADDIDWGRIRRVIVEYHDYIQEGSSHAVLTLLEKYGFPRVEQLGSGPAGMIRASRKPSGADA